jgi:predicted RNA-binding protein (virulence factor B family)
MEKFYLRVINGSSTFTTTVIAEEVEVGDTGNIYYFLDDDGNWIATYPTHSTIIEKFEPVNVKTVETKSTENNNKIKHNITEI